MNSKTNTKGDTTFVLNVIEQNGGAPMDLLCKRSEKARLLREELREIQRRLGTEKEMASDISRAADIAHILNNLLCYDGDCLT